MNSVLELIKNLFEFLLKEKKWWLLPIIVVLLLMGALVVITQGSAISPFIYTMF